MGTLIEIETKESVFDTPVHPSQQLGKLGLIKPGDVLIEKRTTIFGNMKKITTTVLSEGANAVSLDFENLDI